MEPYIRKNTDKRKEATSDFEKNLYKLMNNSVFGKTMENLRKHVDVKLVRANEDEKIRKLIAKPTYDRFTIFDDNLAAIHMRKSKLILNRPLYVGMCVLDLSMYDFYYNALKKQYGNDCRLLYTDTDSLLLEIKTDDVYKDMKKTARHYDTSNYPEDHPLYSVDNKKVLGKMKDECAGVPIKEFVGLRAKMYSILLDDGNTIRKAKGVKKNVIKTQLLQECYKETLFDKITRINSMNML